MSSKKIKILQTIRQGKIGGGETHVLDLVGTLNDDRFESVVLSFTDGPMVDRMKSLGIKTYVIHTEKAFDSSKNAEVKKIMEAEKIDIVHAHGTRANSNTYKSAKELSIPIAYTVHGWSFHKDQNVIVRNLRILGERFLVKNSSMTICVSDSNLREGKSHFPIKKAQVIKNAVNQDRFNVSAKYDDLRGELGVKDDEVLVGYIARITKQKDPFTLINAIALLKDQKKIKFLIVGDGDLGEEARGLAEKLGLSDQIIFLNFRQDIPNILNAIDIYCLPSLWEGLPIGILEAMAMHKAIIATDIDANKELVQDGVTGLLVPIKSPELLANAFKSLAADKTLREKLGQNAGIAINRDFNLLKMTQEVEKVYTTLSK
ncbi:glycosyltransferase family 4 protein [Mucilaginibacter aquaedulcis]|uniref:glycosyltransferase family 4 protein n=1 Tax=Mucilaginibacter aquaedulcis TaxID=1187081 RepID=UPI0025B38576|nr:glycosyltransferase family 4 protein [Mucilaginibacter aquaedulcis]MDN3548269.1 glycosyltransferase family 4 protein [Mucilaginibacter aquaedulcis]